MNDGYYGARSELLKFVPRKVGDVLDVGCGSGDFFAALKSGSFEITSLTGIEPLADIAAMARAKHADVIVLEGLFEDVTLGATYDTIFFNDSLEHMVDPEKTLSIAKRLLRPGGRIICSIPNFLYAPSVARIILTRDFKYRERGILDQTHLRFFTRKSIERLIGCAGLDLKVITGINDYIHRSWSARLFVPLALLAVISPILFGVDSRYMQILVVAENP